MSETREYGPTKILRITDAQDYEPTSLSGGKDDYTTTDYLEITGQANNGASSDFPDWMEGHRGIVISALNDNQAATELGFRVKGTGHVFFANDVMFESTVYAHGQVRVEDNHDLYVSGDIDIDGGATIGSQTISNDSIILVANTSMTLGCTGAAASFLGALQLKSYTVAQANDLAPGQRPAGSLIWVLDDVDGACVAYSDGTNWRRIDTNAPISDV